MHESARPNCLFSAPFHFIEENALDDFRSVMPTTFREIWRASELEPSAPYTAWIVNPGQDFTVDPEILDRMPRLEVLVTPSTGRNHIQVEACRSRGVTVLSLLDDRPTLDTISASAEFTFLLLLNALRRLDFAVSEVREGRWREREDDLRGVELQGKRVGIVGFGRIGQRIARYCTAFDARVSYHDPHVTELHVDGKNLERIFSDSDVVCVCCALTVETTGMVGYELLRRLRPGAVLVNTSRGEVLVEKDLVRLLGERDDVRVGLDVLSGEASGAHRTSALIALHREGRIVVTPHVAGATVESQTKAAKAALNLLRRHVDARV